MSARTRAQIKTLIETHTGRTKDTLENSECDSALRVALLRHPFKDAQSEPSDIALTEDATSVSIATVTGLINIVTARIVEASGTRNMILKLKTRNWWDENVINPEDNPKGWPEYALRWGSTIVFDRPLESGLELRLRVTTEQTFSADSTVCPIAVLDLFVEHYATAHVFKSLRDSEGYKDWLLSACGARWLIDGTIGGELANAIEADCSGDLALEIKAEAPRSGSGSSQVAIRNLITGHEDYGNTRSWR